MSTKKSKMSLKEYAATATATPTTKKKAAPRKKAAVATAKKSVVVSPPPPATAAPVMLGFENQEPSAVAEQILEFVANGQSVVVSRKAWSGWGKRGVNRVKGAGAILKYEDGREGVSTNEVHKNNDGEPGALVSATIKFSDGSGFDIVYSGHKWDTKEFGYANLITPTSN